jgi:hypothetical protein
VLGKAPRQVIFVAVGRWAVVLEPKEYRVLEMSSGTIKDSRITGKPAVATKSAAAARAREFLLKLGWAVPKDFTVDLPEPDEKGNVRHTEIWVKFSNHQVSGYPSADAGNRASIGLDSLNGDLLRASRVVGSPLSSASVRVSSAQVRTIAEGKGAGIVSKADGPRWFDMARYDDLSPRGAALLEERATVLAYYVYGSERHMLVAADDGDVLGSIGSGMANGSGYVGPPGATKPGSSTLGTVLLVGSACMVALAGGWWMTRKRQK